MNESPIFVKHAEFQRIPAGQPWIYSNQIDTHKSPLRDYAPGEIVDLFHDTQWLAKGYINPHSLIAFRVLSWEAEEQIDHVFFEKRFKQALSLREAFYDQPYYRLVHAEGDFLPGLIIDRYNDVFVVQLNTAGMDNLAITIQEALKACFTPRSIIIKRDSASRLQEGLTQEEDQIIGDPVFEYTIKENGVQFLVNLAQGQKTGWFFDQRDNRALVASLCKNKTVIDYYAYAGGFSLAAAKQGAKNVIAIDRSAPAIALAQKSAALNELTDKTAFLCKETFADMLERIEVGEKFDVVIVDPPAFIKVKKDKSQGIRGYQKLMQHALQLVKPQGFLFIASCSYHISVSEFKECLQKACSKVDRCAQILVTVGAGKDHPISAQLAETDYLKGLLVRVLDKT